MTLLEIENLSVRYSTGGRQIHAVNGVSFDVRDGEIYGLVGESGSGKSTIGDAVIDLLPDNASLDTKSKIEFEGENMIDLTNNGRQHLLWEDIAYIPQSAMDALDPVMSTGGQIVQAIRKHRDVSTKEARNRAKEVFSMVGLDPMRTDDYPHEFSGGMRQRVTIAMAMALEPKLIIADEPTTGLDVIIQDKIHKKILELQQEIGASLLMITHDIGLIAEMSDRLSILYGGKVMEQGPTKQVLASPTNPYTMGLKNSFPELEDLSKLPVSIPGVPPTLDTKPTECVFRERCPFAQGECTNSHPDLVETSNGSQFSACHFAECSTHFRNQAQKPDTWEMESEHEEISSSEIGDLILETKDLRKWYRMRQSVFDRITGKNPTHVKAVDGINIRVHRSEIVGLAGESGCGKSTLGETIVRLTDSTSGEVIFKGGDISEYNENELTKFREDVQFVFQDPFESLNPRQSVRKLVTGPLEIHGLYNTNDETPKRKVIETLEEVGLDPAEQYLDKYPHELSGGERQRVAVARALVVDPDFIVCDEPASMLDVSLKVGLLNLLKRLSRQSGIGILYISHDIASLAHISDKLAIMYLGRIVEFGDSEDIITNTRHPYTAALLAASPNKDPMVERTHVMLPGEPPNPVNLPDGCNFAPRCPHAQEKCKNNDPVLTSERNTDHKAACYFPMGKKEKIIDIL